VIEYVAMRINLKHLFASVAVAAILFAVGTWYLQQPATDTWSSTMSIRDGTGKAPAYVLEVRGVGNRAVAGRIVRFDDPAVTVSDGLIHLLVVDAELSARTRNIDRWRADFTLIAGRSSDEQIEISVDPAEAEKWFGGMFIRFESYRDCEKFWNRHVEPHLPATP
jgi:hypothetical protein